MILRSGKLIAVGLVVAAFATGCGSSDSAGRQNSSTQAAKAAADHEASQARSAAIAACHRKFDPLVNELRDLDSGLSVGMNYDEYTDEVRDVRVTYGRIDNGSPDPKAFDCLQNVGLPAEAALNEYADAVDAWGDCFDDASCDNDTVQPTLQKHWTKAGRKIDQAQKGFDKIEAPASDTGMTDDERSDCYADPDKSVEECSGVDQIELP